MVDDKPDAAAHHDTGTLLQPDRHRSARFARISCGGNDARIYAVRFLGHRHTIGGHVIVTVVDGCSCRVRDWSAVNEELGSDTPAVSVAGADDDLRGIIVNPVDRNVNGAVIVVGAHSVVPFSVSSRRISCVVCACDSATVSAYLVTFALMVCSIAMMSASVGATLSVAGVPSGVGSSSLLIILF